MLFSDVMSRGSELSFCTEMMKHGLTRWLMLLMVLSVSDLQGLMVGSRTASLQSTTISSHMLAQA